MALNRKKKPKIIYRIVKTNKRYEKNIWMKLLIAVSFISLYAFNAGAVEEPYMNELKGTRVAAGQFFSVADEKYNNTSDWNTISNHISTDNIISFEINFDTTIYFYNT